MVEMNHMNISNGLTKENKMICPSYPDPSFFIITSEVPQLVYYSHVPVALLSLFFGFFIFFKNKKPLINKTLFLLSISFFLWVFFDLIQWTNNNSDIIFFTWSLMGMLSMLISIFSLYFSYLFIYEKDFSVSAKFLLVFTFLPIAIFTPTIYNLVGFDINICGIPSGLMGEFFDNYTKMFSFLILLTITFLAFKKCRKIEHYAKKKIFYFTLGIDLFLFFFIVADFLSVYLAEKGFFDDLILGQYGLFGMIVFLGFLTYLIVKFKAFDIKLIGAQALVYSLVILIGSQFFFIQNRTNQILNGVTLLLAIIFGIFLIKSVKAEIRRKEELQDMTEKLAIANDQLRKLDNAKSEFISIASHQLRTPLTAIKGYASLILEGTYGEVNQGITEPINKIYASNERLVQLVEELLNISKIESGKMEFNFEKHRIEDIVKDLSDTFVILAKDKKLYFNTELPEEPTPEVEIDTSKIREVISNLIDNSIKYTRRGGVNVKVELVKNATWKVKHQFKSEKPVIMDGAAVKITVSDTGIGIPKDDLSYLFSKFSRGRDTKRLHANGTGLGLYVGKNIIEAHHGKIWAESEGAEKGSRFIIELPLEQPK